MVKELILIVSEWFNDKSLTATVTDQSNCLCNVTLTIDGEPFSIVERAEITSPMIFKILSPPCLINTNTLTTMGMTMDHCKSWTSEELYTCPMRIECSDIDISQIFGTTIIRWKCLPEYPPYQDHQISAMTAVTVTNVAVALVVILLVALGVAKHLQSFVNTDLNNWENRNPPDNNQSPKADLIQKLENQSIYEALESIPSTEEGWNELFSALYTNEIPFDKDGNSINYNSPQQELANQDFGLSISSVYSDQFNEGFSEEIIESSTVIQTRAREGPRHENADEEWKDAESDI